MTFSAPAVPGITIGMPFQDYLAIDRLSASGLKRMAESPLAYKWAKDHGDTNTRSKSQGTATHTAILEPERFQRDVVLWTGAVRNGKAWDLFKEAHAGKQILNQTEMDEVLAMQSAVRGNAAAMRYLQEGVAEVTLQWTDPTTGRKYKGRVDWLTQVDGQTVFVDLKTTRDCTPRRFCSDAYRLSYHIQFSLYTNGGFYLLRETPRFVVIAVENKQPHDVAVFNVPDNVLEQGYEEYSELEHLLSQCEESGLWPGRNTEEIDLALPAWVDDTEDDDLTDLDLIP